MSRESKLAEQKSLQEKYLRIKKTKGRKAMYAEAWKDSKEEFFALPYWRRPFYVLRILIGTPIALLIGLIVLLITAIVAVTVWVVVAVVENFWKCFAVFCLVLAVFALINLGVL